MKKETRSIISGIVVASMILSYQSPAYGARKGTASSRLKEKIGLYKKCVRGACSKEEKDIVRSDLEACSKKGPQDYCMARIGSRDCYRCDPSF